MGGLLTTANNTSALLDLARVYQEGKVVKADFELALDYLQTAADIGNPVANVRIANFYFEGISVPVDIDKATNYLLNAVGLDEASLLKKDAYEYVTTYDSKETMQSLIEQYNNNDPMAAYRIAHRYTNGDITSNLEQNVVLGCEWLTRSFSLGYADAYEELIECLQNNYLPNYYLQQPVEVIALAAKMHNYDVESFIAEHFYWPHLVELDYAKAFKYFNLAIEVGDDIAMNHLGVIHRDGLGTEINLEAAYPLFKNSAEMGNEVAMHNFAMMLIDEEDNDSSLKQVVFWMQRSAQKKYAPTQFELAKFYLQGRGVERNLEISVSLFKGARSQDMEEAECYIIALNLIQSTQRGVSENGQNLLKTCTD